jgi:hypothetical protein
MDDPEDSDEGQGGRNHRKPDGRMLEKDNKKKKVRSVALKIALRSSWNGEGNDPWWRSFRWFWW